jgi:hypothetical protein
MAGEPTDKALRQLETILDSHYRSLPFFCRPPARATYTLLATFDSLYAIEPSISPHGPSDMGVIQKRRALEEGLSQSLRWVLGNKCQTDPIPSSDAPAMDEAYRFIEFAGEFNVVEDFHILYGKGWVDVDVDFERKQVRFMPRADGDPRATMAGIEEEAGDPLRARGGSLDRRVGAAVDAARHAMRNMRHELRDGRIVLLDLHQVDHPAVVQLQGCLRTEFEDIPASADLGGFTVDEFQSYWAALGRWSISVTQLYLRAIFAGVKHEECMPTQCEPKDRFILGICELAGLSTEKVRTITDRLSWGPAIKRPDITLQPLIVGPNTVAWSPRVLELSKYPRNMLKLMAKLGGETKKIADNLVGQREGPAAERLGAFMAAKRRSRWRHKSGQKISCGTKTGEIDLLAWTPDCADEILLIEYKACLEAGEIHEIGETTKLMQTGQNQLRRCIEILGLLENEDKTKLYPFVPWERVKSVYGIVVTSGGNPGDVFDFTKFPAITRNIFVTRLRSGDFLRPSRLWAACRDRRWLHVLDRATFHTIELRIGELMYSLPGVMYVTEEKEKPTRRRKPTQRFVRRRRQ